ncbi:MAG: DUF2007 domain-containing protein [Deltaproteobacteria bacterium]|nr:DUF2007 domain-containing protein [Deltaproteobacteria bacterium]
MPEDREYRLVTVATFADNVQAGLMRERLESEGIAAFIPDEHAAQLTGIPNAFGGIRLQVFEPDEREAERIIGAESDPLAEQAIELENQLDPDQRTAWAGDDPICPACKSDLVFTADYRIGQLLVSMLLLGLPLLFIRRDLECRSCGHRWNPESGLDR